MQKQNTTILSGNKSQTRKDTLNPIENTSPDNWRKVKLMDICTLRTEIIDPEKISNCRYVGLEHIDMGQPYLTRWGAASDVKSSKFRFYPNDILYGKLRPYLEKSVKMNFEGICSTDILVLCPNFSVDADFLSYLTHTDGFTNYAMQSVVGVNHPRTSWSSLANFDILLPSPLEQRAIAHVLQTVQQAIQSRRKELKLERERKAALMQHLFTHGTQNEPTKQSEVGEIPEGWRVAFLADLCGNEQGFVQTGPFGSQLHAYDYRAEGTPIINPTHLGINIIVEENIPLIDQKDVERLARHCLLEGDILISRRGDFSRYSYISSKHTGCVCGTGCLLIRLNNPDVDNYFLSICIGSTGIQRYLSDNAVGSIMPNINTKILERMPIALPPSRKEQQDIANISRACDAKITALEKEIILHEELFRALLDELMTGRISTLPLVEELEKGTLTNGQRTPNGTGTTA